MRVIVENMKQNLELYGKNGEISRLDQINTELTRNKKHFQIHLEGLSMCALFDSVYMKLGSVWSLSRVRLLATPWTAALQASLSITNSLSLLKLLHQVSDAIQPYLLLSPSAFSLAQHQGLFPVSQFFASGGQSTGVSASVFPMNIQD